jgi:transcriptional regulator with XRE-family HTH domain
MSPASTSRRSTKTKAEVLKEFGLRLKNQALILGLKGAEVARRAGLDERRYNNYANGEREPGLEELRRIAVALEMTMDELMDQQIHAPREDRETLIATARFRELIPSLSTDEINMLSDLGERASWRREDQRRREDSGLPKAAQMLAAAHEFLIPSLVRTFKPSLLETATYPHEDGNTWLQISLIFTAEKRDDFMGALKALAKERLPLIEEPIRVRKQQRPRSEWAATLSFRLGPKLF